MNAVQMSKRILDEILLNHPKLFPGVDVTIALKPPIKVTECSRKFSCRCGCYYPTTLTRCEGDLLTVKTERVLNSVHRVCKLDSWLTLDVWIVQCDRCGQIYWS